jgi:antitoxin (DNA-binding transcriptional repressor) of toxin-antitoxin stability system
MIRLNIHEAKTHLSRYLARVERGEVIVLCKRNVPVAEIRAVARPSREPRPLGLGREIYPGWTVPDSFFDPLPDDLLAAFEDPL